MFWCCSMQYAATVGDGTQAMMVHMSYQRALFYFAQLSTMIFSVHSREHRRTWSSRASPSTGTTAILRHEANIRASHELSFVGISLLDSSAGAHNGTSQPS